MNKRLSLHALGAFFLLGTLILSACGTKVKRLDTPEGTLEEGDRLTKAKFFEEAREQYFRIKSEFPESRFQIEADLKIADSYFREKSYESAAESYRNFIQTYPGHEQVSFALYRLGLSYANQMPSHFQRDSRTTEKAVDAFTRLIIDFPESEYYQDALTKIDDANNRLAQKRYQIGRFYEKQNQYEAAARRYAQVMDLFADHPLAEESFARRIRMLKRAGETERAQALEERFVQTYPNSEFMSFVK